MQSINMKNQTLIEQVTNKGGRGRYGGRPPGGTVTLKNRATVPV